LEADDLLGIQQIGIPKGPIDTHAHFADLLDKKSALERAKKAGLSGIIAVGTTLSACKVTLELAQSSPGYIHTALGIHPTEFFDQNLQSSLDFITENKNRCIAIGEIGLDYWNKLIRKDKAQKERQIEFYVTQLRLARELDLPVSIHSRGAWGDCLKYASENSSGKGVFHWYSGPLDILKDILDVGFYVSCTPALESSLDLRAAMANTPIERILVETDSPVWIKSQNRPSEPADVLMTIKHLVDLKGLSKEDVVEATSRNAITLFKI
jgi:TatD DNase family protein